jgi:hypothetical protein
MTERSQSAAQATCFPFFLLLLLVVVVVVVVVVVERRGCLTLFGLGKPMQTPCNAILLSMFVCLFDICLFVCLFVSPRRQAHAALFAC